MYQRFLKQVISSFGKNLSKMAQLNSCSGLNGFCTNKILDLETNRIVWIDMEMTGLNVDKDKIMEIACLVTDSDLNIIAESPEIVINQPKKILDNMNEWCINQHGKDFKYSITSTPQILNTYTLNAKVENMTLESIKQLFSTGLTEACLNSEVSLEAAETTILDFLKKHVTEKTSPLAGNSVYMDRFFLIKHMPKVNDYLHYRIIDVSTIKEICRRWNPDVYKNVPKKQFDHRALQDIRESVEELKFYKENFFVLN